MKPLRWVCVFAMFLSIPALAQVEAPDASYFVAAELPESPGAIWAHEYAQQQAQNAAAKALCPDPTQTCPKDQEQNRPFVDKEKRVVPLTPEKKAKLAVHDVVDPFNLLTAAAGAAYFVATNSHSGYGPGAKGIGYNTGVSLSQDATGELFGTFLIPTLFHQDPRYFRMPHARPLRRIVHALAHDVVAQGDDGRLMPNYANLIAPPICAEIANLYVPGVGVNGPSTMDRIVTGFATQPIGTLIAEFLPDIAIHIHVHILIVQRVLNQISAPNQNQTTMPLL